MELRSKKILGTARPHPSVAGSAGRRRTKRDQTDSDPMRVTCASIHDLPVEILEMIYKDLPTKILLICRQVSKLWRTVSSSVCCRQYVMLNMKGRRIDSGDISRIFDADAQLPWSACQIESSRYRESSTFNRKPDLQSFGRKFGSDIRKLVLQGDHCRSLVQLLHSTPNLEHLVVLTKISEDDMDTLITKNGDAITMDFGKLRRLEARVNGGGDCKFLELILTNRPPVLTHVLLSVAPGNGGETAKNLFSLIARVPFISLCFRPQDFWFSGLDYIMRNNDIVTRSFESLRLFSLLMAPKIMTRELSLDITPRNTDVPHFFRPLAQYLSSSSDSLEKMTLRLSHFWDGGRNNAPNQLTIPTLPAVRSLNLSEGGSQAGITVFRWLVPFTPNQFPVLEKLEIHTSCSGDFGMFGSHRFDTVTELVESGRSLNRYTWGRNFPNLRKLTCEVDSLGLLRILRWMTHLEDLKLKVNATWSNIMFRGQLRRYCEGDVNALLSGVLKPETADHTTYAWLVRERASPAGIPSLRLLTRLKKLDLDLSNLDPIHRRDSTLFYSLVKFQPLDLLSIQNGELAIEIEAKLALRHHELRIQSGSSL